MRSDIREDFPILSRTVNGKPLVYLDNAATTQKPQAVIRAITECYEKEYANVHRGIHTLSEQSTRRFEDTRRNVQEFINAAEPREIIFTRGTTESINIVSHALQKDLSAGKNVVVSELEHHANLVPWQQACTQSGAELRFIAVDDETGKIDMGDARAKIDENTRMVAISHCSNVFGCTNPVEELVDLAHEENAHVLLDAAQSVPHMPVNVQQLDADFLAFSAHKMCGPTGTGVLYGKANALEKLEPLQYGGEMIRSVQQEKSEWNELPHRLEGGTPNIAGVIGFGAALAYLNDIGMETIAQHSRTLSQTAHEHLDDSLGEAVTVYGGADRLGLVSFSLDSVHPHDLATILDKQGVAIRAGHHCAQPLHEKLGVRATARASFYLYNMEEEVERLVDGVKTAREVFA